MVELVINSNPMFKITLFAAVIFLSGFVFGNTAHHKHIIVIDAGSTGSRIFIFDSTHDLKEQWMFKEKKAGGIHTVSSDLSKLPQYLDPLISFAQTKLSDFAHETPIYFRATGGMRSLEITEQKHVLRAVENYFGKAGFKNVLASVLSGTDEGIYAWIAVNYLLKKLSQENPLDTLGVLDMGGASTQTTFVPVNTPVHGGYKLTLGKQTYELYSHSYDGLGMQLGLKALSSPSCENQGDFELCRQNIIVKLKNILKDTYKPELHGNFVAIGGFAQLVKVFRLKNLAPVTLENYGRYLCAMPWLEVKTLYEMADLPQFLATGCFEMAYYSVLMPNTPNPISASEKINDQAVSIAFGIAVYETLHGKISAIDTDEL